MPLTTWPNTERPSRCGWLLVMKNCSNRWCCGPPVRHRQIPAPVCFSCGLISRRNDNRDRRYPPALFETRIVADDLHLIMKSGITRWNARQYIGVLRVIGLSDRSRSCAVARPTKFPRQSWCASLFSSSNQIRPWSSRRALQLPLPGTLDSWKIRSAHLVSPSLLMRWLGDVTRFARVTYRRVSSQCLRSARTRV